MVPEWLTNIIDFISQPWPWWVAGPMIALIMFILLFSGKEFGISANFRTMCAADGDDMADFFKFDWKSQGWNLMVALGAVFGGYLAANYFTAPDDNLAHVSTATVESLRQLGFQYQEGQVPLVPDFYTWEALFTLKGLLVIVVGGFLVGLGRPVCGRLHLRPRHQRHVGPAIGFALRRHRLFCGRAFYDSRHFPVDF